ncbi:iron(III) transport system ATP-binding protein [Pseudonocardia thermophila]|uniref:Iron(III) transport system ATP-binding protein n=1 Tax=Pseudonocardia thermophila TaxID=1848 RepID=A0A1M7BBC3_PSETH|nr:ABC transporter ATP-binding protein [Pseudonocardia thermophila]SHL51939.1 iron(III) transport system ATP-binding protein [Pseudonocardia thermophila]
MSHLLVTNLHKQFAGKPPTTAIDQLSFEIEEGEFVVLLGPSGCGKTTTLRCLAGLEKADAGTITLGGRTWFDSARRVALPPEKRNIGMVFQSYALWPHMTVRRNIGYPLRARRKKGQDAARWVEEAAALVGCQNLLDRYPAQLSGGQQQRVSLARSLVSRPDLILFDEPLSNLDAKLREDVRAQLHELHRRLRFTAVFVTHDQSEALALAERVAVMREGRFEQIGTPHEVFEHPATEYVADFIGLSVRLEATRTDGITRLAGVAADGRLPAPVRHGEFVLRARPDDLRIGPTAPALPTMTTVPVSIVDKVFGGRTIDVYVRLGEQRVHARIPVDDTYGWVRGLRAGDEVVLGFRPENVRAYASDGAAIVPDEALSPLGS